MSLAAPAALQAWPMALGDALRGPGVDAAVQALVTPRGQTSHGDAGARFVRQVARKGLTLQVDTHVARPPRGLLGVHLSRDEREVGSALLLLRQEEGAWRLEGVTRSAAHAAGWLDGALGALLTWDELPTRPALLQVAHGLLQAAANPPYPDDDPAEHQVLSELGGVLAAGWTLRPVQTAVVPFTDRGAIGLAYAGPEGQTDTRWVYVHRDHTGAWRANGLEPMGRVSRLLEGGR